jgi:flagellar basal-body rod protein FlgG
VTLKEPGASSGSNEVSPAGIFVGLGVRISNTQLDLEQGSPENTNRPLDVAIQGEGFFRVKILEGIGDGLGYTRNGNFFVNNKGQLVVGMGDGFLVQPEIRIPQDATGISISEEGMITYLRPGQVNKQSAGQLRLSNFVNPQGLKLLGGSIYVATESSGPAIENNAGENGAGKILQGYLESSNVDPVRELVTLIKTQRAFELNSQSIQAADQALQTIGNLRRF